MTSKEQTSKEQTSSGITTEMRLEQELKATRKRISDLDAIYDTYATFLTLTRRAEDAAYKSYARYSEATSDVSSEDIAEDEIYIGLRGSLAKASQTEQTAKEFFDLYILKTREERNKEEKLILEIRTIYQ